MSERWAGRHRKTARGPCQRWATSLTGSSLSLEDQDVLRRSSVSRQRPFLVALAAAVGCATVVCCTTDASAGRSSPAVNCGDLVGPRWTAKFGPTTGRYYTVTATNVSCATAVDHFRRIVGRISPGPQRTSLFWHALPDAWCLAPPKGKPFDIGACTIGAAPVMPVPGLNGKLAGSAHVKSFSWHLCIATATQHLTCKFTYLK